MFVWLKLFYAHLLLKQQAIASSLARFKAEKLSSDWINSILIFIAYVRGENTESNVSLYSFKGTR